MVHSSFCSGMNRKYSFITILVHNMYRSCEWTNETNGTSRRKEVNDIGCEAAHAHERSPVSERVAKLGQKPRKEQQRKKEWEKNPNSSETK